jgi:glycosyltransferase involved in cell wall biosynthesis
MAQTYSNWEYIIVNNQSTDGTLSIAEEYTTDTRIRVEINSDFLAIIANHNRAFSLISPDSKYCKVVSADDWIFPEALSRMVDVAESQPSIGLVGSYQLSGGSDIWYVRNYGLPYNSTVICGRDMGRAHILGPRPLDVFGNPTSSLYRADLVRSTDHFYPNETAEADRSACFAALRQSDYGFVHQVLSYERIHEVRETATSQRLNAYLSSKLGDLNTYGSYYLSGEELDACIERLLEEYYSYLASNALMFQNRRFWEYHSRKLQDVGYPLNRIRLSKAVATKLLFAPSRALVRFRQGIAQTV